MESKWCLGGPGINPEATRMILEGRDQPIVIEVESHDDSCPARPPLHPGETSE